MTLTVKVKLLNYAKKPISLLIMGRVHSYFDQKNAYRGTETLKLSKIQLKFWEKKLNWKKIYKFKKVLIFQKKFNLKKKNLTKKV